MKIFIASGNSHKVEEIKTIIETSYSSSNLALFSIQGMDIPEPDEPYKTFMENACHKAQYYAKFTGGPTLSEDAGLCIETLDNFPGVYTKDFLTESGSFENAFSALEKMLMGKNNNAAYFVCAAALYMPVENNFITFEGRSAGEISFPAQGNKCFGFDPIFVPAGYSQTMAELGYDVKNSIGSRAIAIRKIFEQLMCS
jgi:XTP/dITP diphosphohydrolase